MEILKKADVLDNLIGLCTVKRCWEGYKLKAVIAVKRDSRGKSLGQSARGAFLGTASLVWLSVGVLLCGVPALGQSQRPPFGAGTGSATDAGGAAESAGDQRAEHQSGQQADQQVPGSISGTIVDATGALVAGARVKLTREDRSLSQEALTDDGGQFSFANIAPGPFTLTIALAGFATQTSSGTLHSGEGFVVPQITLTVATAVTRVTVLPPEEIAEIQIKEEEKQRVLGVIPNFYVSYIPNAAPLNPRQKFELAWKSTVDPITFVMVAGTAGLEQAQNQFGGYGQGAEGYGKRYGAAYGDMVTGTFIGSAILPSLLKQDPRYFYKGTGSTRSRFLYAVANAVICKGDNGRWQPNYSSILGSVASGGISNLYYPPNDRGAGLVFENAAVGFAASAAANVIQEFVIRRLTPNSRIPDPNKP
jgi:Carboxypeptidase regulatory-like domain